MKDKNLSIPPSRNPPIPDITSVEQLLPMARFITKRERPLDSFHLFNGASQTLEALALKQGEKVVYLADSTLDPLVAEAFAIAIREAGGKLDIINLEGYPQMVEPVDLQDSMFSRNWIPGWAWSAINEADIFMQGVFLKLPHTPNLPLNKGKVRVIAAEWTRDLLASDYELFPAELLDAIDTKCWKMLDGAREIKLTDLEGTNLSIKISPEEWERRKKLGLGTFPGHLTIAVPVEKEEGILVTSSLTFGGPIPKTVLTIEGGRVTRVEGGSKFGERLLESFGKYSHIQGRKNPGPGADWFGGMSICTHPRARRSPAFENMSGSGRMHAWAFGHRRSGVIHCHVGDVIVSPDYKVVRYMDLYFPTFIADGHMVIDKGHLTILDDPDVKQIASKYGDPKVLLREEWIPAVSGVNAP